MTVSTTISEVTRSWTGVETVFSTGMRAEDVSGLVVSTAVGLVLTRGYHYQSEIDGAGLLNVRPLTPMIAGIAATTLLIRRVTADTQPIDLRNSDGFDGPIVERELDRRTLSNQELRLRVDRAVTALALLEEEVQTLTDLVTSEAGTLPISAYFRRALVVPEAREAPYELPVVASRRLKALEFDTLGNPVATRSLDSFGLERISGTLYLYVDFAAGDDNNDGRYPETPFKTRGRAWDYVCSTMYVVGLVVIYGKGTHTGDFTRRGSYAGPGIVEFRVWPSFSFTVDTRGSTGHNCFSIGHGRMYIGDDIVLHCGAGAKCTESFDDGHIFIGDVIYDECTDGAAGTAIHHFNSSNSKKTFTKGYRIRGSAQYHDQTTHTSHTRYSGGRLKLLANVAFQTVVYALTNAEVTMTGGLLIERTNLTVGQPDYTCSGIRYIVENAHLQATSISDDPLTKAFESYLLGDVAGQIKGTGTVQFRADEADYRSGVATVNPGSPGAPGSDVLVISGLRFLPKRIRLTIGFGSNVSGSNAGWSDGEWYSGLVGDGTTLGASTYPAQLRCRAHRPVAATVQNQSNVYFLDGLLGAVYDSDTGVCTFTLETYTNTSFTLRWTKGGGYVANDNLKIHWEAWAR
jgi:hypothetical protein